MLNLDVKKIPFILFFVTLFASAQCELPPVKLEFCDMTIIDGNSDGTPDGVINLYDEYTAQIGGTLALGTWFDPNFYFALDEATGDLFLWDLPNASKTETDYQFELTNPNCTTGPRITINVVLSPFSGIANAPGPDGSNQQICDEGIDPCGSMSVYDLNQVMLSNPGQHLNGTWDFATPPTNLTAMVSANGMFSADVRYNSSGPGTNIDKEFFDLKYTVTSITPCTPDQVTVVRVAVIREIFSGNPNELNICETNLKDGTYDSDIDLSRDAYLVNEDIEGTWVVTEDPTGQITNPGDSMVNLRAVYDALAASNPRFGCETYEYKYTVNNRSAVCKPSDTSAVKFTFHEEVRDFKQDTTIPNEFCVGDNTTTSLNLYDLLEFTTEGSTLFDYPSDCCTNWTFVSGPSNLGLISNVVGDECLPVMDYSHLGTVDLSGLTNADAGTYEFQYLVRPEVNCGCTETSQTIFDIPSSGCSSVTNNDGLCGAETAIVTIEINAFNYAGEDTAGLEFCESDPSIASPINLISLLTTDGINDPIYSGAMGTWTDLDSGGAVITNPFTLPAIIGQMTFNFNYSTTSPAGCLDSADLTFTVYQEYSSGTTTPAIQRCGSDASFDLFDELLGNPDPNGTWTLPDATTTTGNTYIYDPVTSTPGVYTYTVPPNMSICEGSSNAVTVTVFQNSNAGADNMETVCRSEGQFNLATLLDPVADAGGSYEDTDMTGALSGTAVDLTLLTGGTYEFRYVIPASPGCPAQFATYMLTVSDLAEPMVDDATFCISETPTLGDIQVNGATNFVWYDSATSTTPIDTTTVLVNGDVYFVAATDATITCFSTRTSMTATIIENSNAGMDMDGAACRLDGPFDLKTLLDNTADAGGTFIDVDTTGALSGDIVDLSQLAEGTYTFRYEVQASPFCPVQTAILTISITDLGSVTVSDRTFCISDRATLADIQVNGASTFEWFDTATSTEPLDITTVLMNGEDYYVAASDATSTCFSARDSMTATLLPFGDASCDSCINDGVSPNGDSQNDNLDLCDLPSIFPNFEIKIFNRYGTVVYIANANTEPFEGKSNASLTVGNNLPSGTYFYIFDPKDNVTDPFQGNFYLRR